MDFALGRGFTLGNLILIEYYIIAYYIINPQKRRGCGLQRRLGNSLEMDWNEIVSEEREMRPLGLATT